ncbi:hypothetical protein ACFL3V_04505 [Nanoarchaeota archaeon]
MKIRGTLCAIVAALTLGFSADAKPTHTWKYTPERCGFELSYKRKGVDKKIEYDMREKDVRVSLWASGKDQLVVTANEKRMDGWTDYEVTSINNRTALERCYTDKDSSLPCAKKHVMLAEKLVKKHLEGVDKYKNRWRAKDSGRCDILGGWY